MGLRGLALLVATGMLGWAGQPAAAQTVVTTSGGTPTASIAADTGASWDLTDLYQSPESWEASYARTKTAADRVHRYQGTLGKSAASLFKALDAVSALQRESIRLQVYAGLKSDEDVRVNADLERNQRAQALGTSV